MASLSLKVFLALLEAERMAPTAEDEKRVVADQQGLCRMCGSFLVSDLGSDHIAPVK